ncbi:MAG: FAD-dependent oxidoreductase [Gemmatimonadaceae bacterium]
MSDQPEVLRGPDLAQGVAAQSLTDGGMLLGHADGEPVLLTRVGDEFFATGAKCTHYGGPLSEGLVVDGTLRCPWHHARFSLRTGQALCAPALDPVQCWDVEQRGSAVFVGRKRQLSDGASSLPGKAAPGNAPASVVIIGAGAAANAAAEMLRRCAYEGSITMIGAEVDLPYDRPNLSKDYLAGDAQEEWIPLRTHEFYDQHAITLLSGTRVTKIDVTKRRVELDGGGTLDFDQLLIATGADPVRLDIPGATRTNVHYLRSLADCRAIIEAAASARHAVVIGASFIGLEVAAAVRKRGLEVHVVGPEARPLERVLGPELGDMIRVLHEANGVIFHLGETAAEFGDASVKLKSGVVLHSDLVVVGVGVRPNVSLAEGAGLALDRGVLVNEFLETSTAGIFAAGDIARWPDPHSGAHIRVEHWVVAELQGQAAARNMLAGNDHSRRVPFNAVPFFWSQHYGVTVNYVGHAERWDDLAIDGDVSARNATVTFRLGGKTVAVATVGRDRESLQLEARMEASFPATDPPGWGPLRVGTPDESVGSDDVVIDAAIARRTTANPTG